MTFDTPTLALVAGILCAGMALAMIMVWRFVLRERVLLLWGMAQGCFAVGTILITQRGTLPDLITIILANGLILGCYALIWRAACDYRRVMPPTRTLAAAFAIFLGGFVYYTYVAPSIVARIVVMHALIPALMVGSAVTLIRRRNGRKGRRVGAEVVAGLAFLLDASFRLMVLGMVFTYPNAAHPLQNNQVIAMTMLLTIISFSAWGLAVIMMVLNNVVYQLADAKNLLQSVLDAIPARVYWKDRDLRYLGCNRNFAADVGLASSELLPGKTDDDLPWLDPAENFRQDDRRVVADGESMLHHEETLTLADGTSVQHSTTKVPLYDAKHRIIGMVGAYEDITERKRADSALREREALISELLVSASEAIYGVDKDGNGLFVNDTGVRLLGYQNESELIGRHIHDLAHHSRPDGSPYPAQECRLARAFNHAEEIHGDDEVFWRKDGTPFPVEYWSHPMLRDGEVIGAVVTFVDITERKQTADALKRLNENLAERVKIEVGKNMAQERLLIQQSRLAAMGEMVGNIAHQWRQPINALTLLLANIKDAYEYNELTREFLDSEVSTGQALIQKMSGTIDDFRNFFRPNKEKQAFIACDSVQEAIKLVSLSFINNNIEIVHDKGGSPCTVFGYPNEFAQVVLNALSNAKEAILARGVRGEVHIRADKGTEIASISICNNGGCIPEDILPKIFDPYFTTKEKGTGIGLYMSKMIMDNMGGDIVLRNVEDGVEVLLTLPLAPIPETAPRNA